LHPIASDVAKTREKWAFSAIGPIRTISRWSRTAKNAHFPGFFTLTAPKPLKNRRKFFLRRRRG
jgi:hypothetical protein